mgnify:CR=1 FL=1
MSLEGPEKLKKVIKELCSRLGGRISEDTEFSKLFNEREEIMTCTLPEPGVLGFVNDGGRVSLRVRNKEGLAIREVDARDFGLEFVAVETAETTVRSWRDRGMYAYVELEFDKLEFRHSKGSGRTLIVASKAK